MNWSDVVAPVSEALDSAPSFYSSYLRTGLFTGFISLTAILFAVQNFLLTSLYRDVYGKRQYREYAKSMEPERHPLDRLRMLAERMRACTTACLIAAAVQLTIGLIPHWFAVCVAIAVALFAAWKFFRLYQTQRHVVDSWLQYLVEEADFDDFQEAKRDHSKVG